MSWPRGNPGFGREGARFPGSFLLALKKGLTAKRWEISEWQGHHLFCRDPEGREQILDLGQLYRRARAEDRHHWPHLIETWLETIPHGIPCLENWEAIAQRILVLLGSLPFFQAVDEPLWCEPLSDPLAVSLVVDFPQALSYFTPEIIDQSGRSPREWLDVALDNLQSRTPDAWSKMLLPEMGLRQSIVGDGYDSSRALIVSRLLPEYREHGYFVVVPDRDLLLVAPTTRASVQQLPALKAVAVKYFQNAQRPLCDDVFWVHEGRWHPFEFQVDGDHISVLPVEAFQPVYERLPPESD